MNRKHQIVLFMVFLFLNGMMLPGKAIFECVLSKSFDIKPKQTESTQVFPFSEITPALFAGCGDLSIGNEKKEGMLDTNEINDAGAGYLAVGNDRIFYEMAGKGPDIVFIHDGLVHREIWDDQFSSFSKNYRVIRYDRRGYGKSTPATETHSAVEDLNNLLDHLDVDKTVLIAMSSGGRLAIDYTLRYPRRVHSLILVGAVVGGFPYTQHFYSRGGHMPTDLSDMEKRMLYYVFDDPYEIYSENRAAKEKVKNLITRNPRKTHHFAARPTSGQPAIMRLDEIDVPTLILVGEYDIPDVHAHAGAINAGIRNSKRDIIPGAGHLIPIEQPALFNQAVITFLKSLSF